MFFKRKRYYKILKFPTGFCVQNPEGEFIERNYGKDPCTVFTWCAIENAMKYCIVPTLEKARSLLDDYRAINEKSDSDKKIPYTVVEVIQCKSQ